MKLLKLTILFFFIILLSSFIATEYFAYQVGYQPALGSNIKKIYMPFAIFIWYFKYYSLESKEYFINAFLSGVVSFTLSYVSFIYITVFRRSMRIKYPNAQGSAKWATFREIKKMGLLINEGVYIGAYVHRKKTYYLRHNGPEHILTNAPTRSGKGVGLIIPSLLSWTESVVVSDLKGELYAITAGWRKKYAKNIILKFEPASLESVKWNPLDEIRINSEYEVGDIQNLATLIVDPDGKGLVDHWSKTSFALIAGCIGHLLEINKKSRFYDYSKDQLQNLTCTMSGLDNLLSLEDLQFLWNTMMQSSDEIVRNAGADMISRGADEGGSVISTSKSFLNLYRDPIVAKNTSFSNFRIRDLMNYNCPTSLYIITQPTDKDRLKPLVRVLLNMIIRVQASSMEFVVYKNSRMAKAKYKYRQLLMLDEFPSWGKMPIIQEALAYIAGYGMKAYIICQDITQLRSHETGYGKDEVITSNCHIQNMYPPARLETAEYISNLCGKATVIKDKVTESGKKFSYAKDISKVFEEQERPLLTADEALTMKAPAKDKNGMIIEAGDMIIKIAGQNPIKGIQPLYFQMDIFKARSTVPTPEGIEVIYSEKPEEYIGV